MGQKGSQVKAEGSPGDGKRMASNMFSETFERRLIQQCSPISRKSLVMRTGRMDRFVPSRRGQNWQTSFQDNGTEPFVRESDSHLTGFLLATITCFCHCHSRCPALFHESFFVRKSENWQRVLTFSSVWYFYYDGSGAIAGGMTGPCARSSRIATILLANPAVKQQCLHCCVSAWRVRDSTSRPGRTCLIIIIIMSAERRPLLDIGLSQGSPLRPVLCFPHPPRSRVLNQVVAPSCRRPTDSSSPADAIREPSDPIGHQSCEKCAPPTATLVSQFFAETWWRLDLSLKSLRAYASCGGLRGAGGRLMKNSMNSANCARRVRRIVPAPAPAGVRPRSAPAPASVGVEWKLHIAEVTSPDLS
ncbi:hypothetical protein MSG28_000103 [Choristoneura fumiferana]|uniref:Uncharacterized protein n=1 Tax=Choristoneura fumiferana TaxID=7141 RepID=A0ACC0JZN9_CHOFU|nr:hypothetical protein MSG28_000103 [Choristoneura fumiferana]